MAEVPGQGASADAGIAEIDGDDLVTLAGAAALGGGFPPGVPDTPNTRALWAEIVADTEAIKARGGQVDIPFNPD